jgi:hypothetical protein
LFLQILDPKKTKIFFIFENYNNEIDWYYNFYFNCLIFILFEMSDEKDQTRHHQRLKGDETEAIFNALDLNHDRVIDANEISIMLRKLDLPSGKREVENVFQSIGANVQQGIGARQFKLYLQTVDKKIHDAYEELTGNGTNCVDIEMFQRAIQSEFLSCVW